jgi:sugar phosphate isomerase/epimerase
MNEIRLVGQAITCTNYATQRLFNFNPELIQMTAECYLASGVAEIEIPEGVLDPNGHHKEAGLDEAAMLRTVLLLPKEARVVATYIGPGSLGKDNAQFLKEKKREIDDLVRFFPDMKNAMIHPPHIQDMSRSMVKDVVKTWAELAKYAAGRVPGFQCGLHNHYDSSCETADQVRMYLDAMGEVDEPALRWGPDTGHCGGMRGEYLTVFEQYAPLIGNHFHIKTRVPAFDKLHEKERYRADRDIWGNKAEFGNGLYGGFVNCADPEIETPLKEVFDIIRRKARPANGVITGALEIDVPRQHPRLEVMCAVLYLKQVHHISPIIPLTAAQVVARVFAW